MNQKPMTIETSKLENICGLNLNAGKCPLLKKINGTSILVCARKTYIDIGFIKPNCQK